MKYVVQRWNGASWYDSLTSPYKTMGQVNKHLQDYWWHYTDDNPYRIIDYKPKKKVSRYVPKYNASKWNTDDDMVVRIGA